MNRGSRKAATTLWILTGLLSALYLFSGGTKLIGMQMHVEHFAQWGYPQWFRLFVGAWEVTSAVLLLIPRASFYGAALLVLAMIGALYTELFRGQPAMAITPAILLGLVSLIAYLRRPPRAQTGRQTARLS
jgi:putative oxidoreductase